MRRWLAVLLLFVAGCASTRQSLARNDYLAVGRVFDTSVKIDCKMFQSDGKHGSVVVPPPRECAKEKR